MKCVTWMLKMGLTKYALKIAIPLMLISFCLCIGCARPEEETTASQPDISTDAADAVTTVSADDEACDSLIGNSFPLMRYRFYLTDGTIKENITDYAVEDSERFELWPKVQPPINVSGMEQAFSDEAGFDITAVEIHTERMKYKALKLDNGVYIIDTVGSLDIWKDGTSMRLAGDGALGLGFLKVDISFADVMGTGKPQLLIGGSNSVSGGGGIAYSGLAVFDMENMCLIEEEDCDQYVREKLYECIETYIAQGGELKEGYKFYVSDSYSNVYHIPQTKEEEYFYHQILQVTYSEEKPKYFNSVSDDNICMLHIWYQYSPGRNMLCVADIELVYE